MTHKTHIFFYTILILALLTMTGVAAFLFGELQTERDRVETNTNPVVNENQLNQNQTNTKFEAQPQNSLAEHNTWITFSDNPESFEEGKIVVESASVPDVLVCNPEISSEACQANEILVYYVDASTLKGPGTEQLGLMRSTDGGESWSTVEYVSISGKSNAGAAVDPSVVLLSDGKIRLYYFGSEVTQGDPASVPGDHYIYSAISSDGVNFTQEEGERLARERMTDPEVVEWKGSWYMLYSVGPNSGLATSTDGLNFIDQDIISPSFGGVPGLLALDDRLLGYGCQQGISSASSTDGITFSKNAGSVLQLFGGMLCDPAVDTYKDQYVMVYKTAPAQSGPQPLGQGSETIPKQTITPLTSNTQKQ